MAEHVAATAEIKVAGVTDWTGRTVTVNGRADLPGIWHVMAQDPGSAGAVAVLSQGTRVVRVTTQRLRGAK